MITLKDRKNNANQRILTVFFTAGYPDMHSIGTILLELQKHKVDMIEIGIPFSDPMADGNAIQYANQIALQNGFSIDGLFDKLKEVKPFLSIPLVIMTYLNPIFKYGIELFCNRAAAAGVDGLIVPDLPMNEFKTQYKPIFKKFNIDMVFMITPHTDEKRILDIAALGSGFIYMVTSSSITGQNLSHDDNIRSYFSKISKLNLGMPVLAGFGIKSKEDIDYVNQYVDGCIIGSAFINSIGGENLISDISNFFKSIQ